MRRRNLIIVTFVVLMLAVFAASNEDYAIAIGCIVGALICCYSISVIDAKLEAERRRTRRMLK